MGIEIRHLFVCCLAVTMLLSLLSLLCPAQTLTHGRRIADAGSQTYYVIADNGDLVTWGSNEPVPNMGKEYLPTPFWGRIVMLEGAVQVCTDGSRCIAVDREGNLWGWSNMGGWIPPAHKKPVLLMEQVKTADLAGGHIGVVKEDGTLWLWGSNEAGELGLGYRDTHYYEQPQQIMDHVSEIYAYEGVTFCIDLEGTLYACGRGTVYPSEEGREFDSVYSFTRLAERIRGVSSLPAMGQGHFALLTEEGEVFFLDLTAVTDGESPYGPELISPEPLARQIRALCENGWIGEDEKFYFLERQGDAVLPVQQPQQGVASAEYSLEYSYIAQDDVFQENDYPSLIVTEDHEVLFAVSVLGRKIMLAVPLGAVGTEWRNLCLIEIAAFFLSVWIKRRTVL